MSNTPGGNPRRFSSSLPRFGVCMPTAGGYVILLRIAHWQGEAIAAAKRMNAPGEYWEVVDCYRDEVIATSESERDKGKGGPGQGRAMS